MPEQNFEGSLVLEQLAAVGLLEDFADAVDGDDRQRAARLMQRAGVRASIVDAVIRKMAEGDGEH